MQTGPSSLSLAASALYILVALSCLVAGTSAAARRQPFTVLAQWGLIAVLFLAMAFARCFDIEHALRQDMRGVLMADGAYEMRREYQRPAAALVVVLSSALAFWLVYKIAQGIGKRRVLAVCVARMAALSLVTLVVLRIVSLHPVDGLLYGPLKLNWIIDIGASMVIMAAAVYFVALLKAER
jgi:hypothetical protein